MRLPNGYGSVYKLSGNRRKPWIARKTCGWDDEGKQLYETVGYYEKREMALQALAEYNSSPYDIKASKISFSELYDKWSLKKYEGIAHPAGYIAAYKTSSDLCDMQFSEIKTRHLQGVIDSCGKNYPTLKNLKILYNQLYKYAMKNDIVSKDYSQFVDIGKNTLGTSRKPFTTKEIEKLWKCIDLYDNVDTILIMIYSGLRPGELVSMKTENIDLEKRVMIGGIKTAAGKDRVIPINIKIAMLVSKRMALGNLYLISDNNGKKLSYDRYYDWWKITLNQLVMTHRPHDCRHTFATLMSNAKADTISLQKIIGHASYNTTANTYTHKDISELVKAIDMI
jgi:integrase